MAESAFRSRIVKAIRLLGHMAVPVENGVYAGTPDIWWCASGVSGWIETKQLPRAPVRRQTPYRIPGLTIYQRDFHAQCAAQHGRSCVVVRHSDTRRWVVVDNTALVHCDDATDLRTLLTRPGIQVVDHTMTWQARLKTLGVVL